MGEKFKEQYSDIYGNQEEPEPEAPTPIITNLTTTLQTITNYYQSHNITSITINDNDELVITYSNNTTSTTTASDEQLALIKAYCQTNGLTSLTRQDLATATTINNNNQTTTDLPLLLISCSLISLSLIVLLVKVLQRKIKRMVKS